MEAIVFMKNLKIKDKNFDYVSDEDTNNIFNLLEIEKPTYEINAEKVKETYFYIPQS